MAICSWEIITKSLGTNDVTYSSIDVLLRLTIENNVFNDDFITLLEIFEVIDCNSNGIS